jgi:hypothetical protein
MKLAQLFGISIVTAFASTSMAATLTSVALQGPSMIHVSLACNGTQLSVSIEPGVPQLTPLDVSNPADSFSPGDPWFDTLDPSRRGLAFNRQFGFVLAGGSELPAGAGIWVRCVSNSPALEMYRYRSTAPATWEPMFGFSGSTNLLQWNLGMFHPAFAAPPGTGTHTAAFEAFLVDPSTGARWPGADAIGINLTLTNTPSLRPTIDAAQCFVVTWPATATNYVLQSANEASAAEWSLVTNTPVMLDGRSAVVLPMAESRRFFRLNRAP